jgi:Flp pilus assembly protein TadD/DNA-binding transcriptional MerR regulator
LSERFTRNEALRIAKVDERALRRWEKLHLIRPRKRRRERFYTFADLVSLATLKRLTANRVPACRVRRAILALERQLGGIPLSLENLRILSNGRQVAVVPPGESANAFEPLSGQLIFTFETAPLARSVKQIISRNAREWFDYALACDAQPVKFEEAVAAYRRVIELAPHWAEPVINLGMALYHLGELEQALEAFQKAAELSPQDPTAHFNLGCVLEDMNDLDEAILHFKKTIRLRPRHADAHFNLAMTYERSGAPEHARKHWLTYLRFDLSGPWSDYARSRIAGASGKRHSRPLPFRRRNS